VVEKAKIIDASRVQVGDVLIGLASSGPHSNGYSLIRKILAVSGANLDQPFANSTLGDALLAPTRIYVKPILKLLEQVKVHAIAHITGGGLTENLPRVLPTGVKACINTTSWQRPAIFQWLQQQGGVIEAEMWRTFNCGVGMVVGVAAEQADQALTLLREAGETVWRLGYIAAGEGEPVVEFQP